MVWMFPPAVRLFIPELDMSFVDVVGLGCGLLPVEVGVCVWARAVPEIMVRMAVATRLFFMSNSLGWAGYIELMASRCARSGSKANA